MVNAGEILKDLPTVAALTAAAISVGLVAAWTTKNNNNPNFLGVPSWNHNVFAYHPVFMVLFLFAQVQAILNWSIFSVVLTAKTAHVVVQLVSVAAVIVALIAVLKDASNTDSPNLTTMHSWVGVAAVTVFGFNFFWGAIMGLAFNPYTIIKAHEVVFKPLLTHKFLGGTALVLTAMAITSGIMDALPDGVNTSSKYANVPAACKIAYGLGISAIVAAFFTLLAVVVRNDAKAAQAEGNAEGEEEKEGDFEKGAPLRKS